MFMLKKKMFWYLIKIDIFVENLRFLKGYEIKVQIHPFALERISNKDSTEV